jgi:hypothetical protein
MSDGLFYGGTGVAGAPVLKELVGAGSPLLVSAPTPHATTGGASSVTSVGAQLEVTGVLVSDATITVPALPGLQFAVVNSTSGAHNVIVETPGGVTSVTVAQGKAAIVYVNSAGNIVRLTPDT